MVSLVSLFTFDVFQAKVLLMAFIVVLGILPTFLVVFLLYQVVSSFILATLSDRQFTRWFVTSLCSFLAAMILLGGVIRSDQNKNYTIKRIYFYSASGIDKPSASMFERDELYAFMTQPFETHAYLGSDFEVLSENSHNVAFWGWLKKLFGVGAGIGAISSVSNTAVKAIGGQAQGVVNSDIFFYDGNSGSGRLKTVHDLTTTLNARLKEYPVLSGTLLYLTNSFSSLTYAALSISQSISADIVQQSTNASLWEKGISYALFEHKFNEYDSDAYAGISPAGDGPELSWPRREHLLSAFVSPGATSALGATSEGLMTDDFLGYIFGNWMYDVCLSSTARTTAQNIASPDSFEGRFDPCAIYGSGVYFNSSNASNDIYRFLSNIQLFSDDSAKDVKEAVLDLAKVFDVGYDGAAIECKNSRSFEKLLETGDTSRSNSTCESLRTDLIKYYESHTNHMYTNMMNYTNALEKHAITAYSTPLLDEAFSFDDSFETLAEDNPTILPSTKGENLNKEEFTRLGNALISTLVPINRLRPAKEMKATSFEEWDKAFKEVAEKGEVKLGAAGALSAVIGSFLGLDPVKKGGEIVAWGSFMWICIKMSICSAVAMAYTIAYFGITISVAIGLALFPIWVVLVLGKLMYHGVVGDSRGGISVFPVIELIGFPLLIGVELAMLGAMHGMTCGFVASGQNAAAAAAFSAIQQVFADGLNDVGQSALSISTMLGATSTLGVLIGLGVVPVELAKVLRREVYSTDSSQVKNQMQGGISAVAVEDNKMQNVGATGAALGRRFMHSPARANASGGRTVAPQQKQNLIQRLFKR